MKKLFFISLIVLFAVIAAGLKGVSLLWKRRSPNGTDWWRNSLGWSDPRMKIHWDRLTSGEPYSHVLTNLVVEWFEMDKESLRRGVKVFSGVIVVQWLLLVIGWLL